MYLSNLTHARYFLLAAMLLLMGVSASAQTIPAPANPSQRIRPPLPEPPTLSARSYVLVDFTTGKVLAEKEPDLQLEPASITKVMTSYVVFSELASGNLQLNEEVVISEKAWRMGGSRMFIEVGKRVSIEDLIRGMVVASGNDASVALAEHIAGSEAAFADLMNQYARSLGMNNTYFLNATGWPAPEHVTTANDIARLSVALIRDYPDYYAYYAEEQFEFNDVKQPNRNRLLFRDDSVDGIKTGHTEAAGYCLAASSVKEDMRLVSVVMGAASENQRADDSQALLNYGHRFYETSRVYAAGEQLGQTTVWKGAVPEVAVMVPAALNVTVPRGRYDDLVATLGLQGPLQAPLSAGQVIGELQIRLDNEVIATSSLQAAQSVPQAGILKRWWHGIRLWSGAGQPAVTDDE